MKKNPYACYCPLTSCPHLDAERNWMIAAGVPDLFTLLDAMQPPVRDQNPADEVMSGSDPREEPPAS